MGAYQFESVRQKLLKTMMVIAQEDGDAFQDIHYQALVQKILGTVITCLNFSYPFKANWFRF